MAVQQNKISEHVNSRFARKNWTKNEVATLQDEKKNLFSECKNRRQKTTSTLNFGLYLR